MDQVTITKKLADVAKRRGHRINHVIDGMCVCVGAGASEVRLVVTSLISIEMCDKAEDLPRGLTFEEVIKRMECFMVENCEMSQIP